jgi:integrase
MDEQATRRRRPKGTGSLYPVRWDDEGNPTRWMIAYRTPEGRRQRELFATKSEAQRTLRKRCGARDSGLPVVPYAERTTFEDGVKMIEDDFATTGKSSWDDVDRRIRLHLKPVFEGRRLIGIRSDDAVHYAAARQKAGASNAQINRELQVLKRILSLAVRHGKLPSKPHIALLQEHNARTGFFDDAQVASVCQHLQPEIADVVRFAYITGWRIASEVLPLAWHQVDFKAGEIRLAPGTTKNREGRVFRMTAGLRKRLERRQREHKKLQKAGHLIPNVFWRMVAEGRRGPKKPQAIVRFEKSWRLACKAAGCPGRIPHDLRRSAVRNFVRAGIPERVAMALSGHKTRSVFERYNVTSPGDLDDAARKLDAVAPGKISSR